MEHWTGSAKIFFFTLKCRGPFELSNQKFHFLSEQPSQKSCKPVKQWGNGIRTQICQTGNPSNFQKREMHVKFSFVPTLQSYQKCRKGTSENAYQIPWHQLNPLLSKIKSQYLPQLSIVVTLGFYILIQTSAKLKGQTEWHGDTAKPYT